MALCQGGLYSPLKAGPGQQVSIRHGRTATVLDPAGWLLLGHLRRYWHGFRDKWLCHCHLSSHVFGFVLLSSCQDVMTDIKNKCKYVSMSQGLSARAYWLGNFMAHLVLLLPAAMEFVIVYLLLRPPSTPIEVLPMVILAILLYPIPLTLCVYNFTVAMAGSESVSKVVPVMLMTTQLLPALITSIITAAYVPESLAGFANAWHVTLSVLNPNYGLPGLIAYIINVDGPKKLSVGGYFATLSAVPLYMMFVTSSVCLFNLVRLDAGLYSETELQSAW